MKPNFNSEVSKPQSWRECLPCSGHLQLFSVFYTLTLSPWIVSKFLKVRGNLSNSFVSPVSLAKHRPWTQRQFPWRLLSVGDGRMAMTEAALGPSPSCLHFPGPLLSAVRWSSLSRLPPALGRLLLWRQDSVASEKEHWTWSQVGCLNSCSVTYQSISPCISFFTCNRETMTQAFFTLEERGET